MAVGGGDRGGAGRVGGHARGSVAGAYRDAKAGERTQSRSGGGRRAVGAPGRRGGESSPSYRFTALQADGKTPVTYDPCRPVHYVVRTQGAPVGGQALITEAVGRVARATGLQFRDDGTTSEAPSGQREPFQKDRYGDRWAPVLIAW
jgi:hypothetical protein